MITVYDDAPEQNKELKSEKPRRIRIPLAVYCPVSRRDLNIEESGTIMPNKTANGKLYFRAV